MRPQHPYVLETTGGDALPPRALAARPVAAGGRRPTMPFVGENVRVADSGDLVAAMSRGGDVFALVRQEPAAGLSDACARLTPDEARAYAAQLVVHADRAERQQQLRRAIDQRKTRAAEAVAL